MRLLVTRPREQAASWVQRLREAEVPAEALPLLAIAPALDPAPIQAAWRSLAARRMVMFVSANAVQHFFAQRPRGCDWPAALRAGSTGPGTTEALRAHGLGPEQVVAPAQPPFETEGLWALIQHEPWAGAEVLLVRGEGGRDWLQTQWKSAGAQVSVLSAYRRQAPQWNAAEQALALAAWQAPQQHVWWFSSGEGLDHLPAMMAPLVAPLSVPLMVPLMVPLTGASVHAGLPPTPPAAWQSACALASHERIAERARALGFGQVWTVPPLLADVVPLMRQLQAARLQG